MIYDMESFFVTLEENFRTENSVISHLRVISNPHFILSGTHREECLHCSFPYNEGGWGLEAAKGQKLTIKECKSVSVTHTL